MDKGTRAGVAFRAEQWVANELDVLGRLWLAGVAVSTAGTGPRPAGVRAQSEGIRFRLPSVERIRAEATLLFGPEAAAVH